MIKTIAHFADIHVAKSLERHDEYRKVLNKVYENLEKQKPDRIVVAGDTYNDYIDLEGEALIMIGEILNRFSRIAPVIITRGNHEIRKKNRSRIDTVKTVTDLLQNSAVTYYDKSGFYEDENVVWAVWDHVDRRYNKINTWKDIPHTRKKDKIYIDIYHDPVNGCKYHNGYNPGKIEFPSPSDLKGNFSFLGDIHLRQFFNNRTKAYPSSLVQQNHGEDPFGHGYLLWDIEKGTVQEINIDNEHRLINFEIVPDTDYDKLHLVSKWAGKYNKIKVEWREYAAFVTNENENKIRKYLKEKYNPEEIEIRPSRIYADIKDGKMLSEIININDKLVQQEIIKQYLKENKFEDVTIDKIIEIDNIVNDRLQLTEARNIIWNIDKIWFNNFKSYGDNNIIEWDAVNGIVQIGGENQQGKTSIIDAICFILYGTTTSTTKDEKNGNNRYINKNRKINFCDGGAVIDVNGEKYIMYRRVDREYKKGREIKACPMTLDYYEGTEMVPGAKLNGERKTSTQKLLNEVLGTFDDFVRLALTNADNLNSLLSMNRSVFIDSIIRDAGYDIFEKKLKEFKEYKDDLNLEKINLNVLQTQEEIKRIENDLKDKEDYLSDTEADLLDVENKINEENIKKDDNLIKLHKIDDEILKINIDEVKRKVKNTEREKERISSEIKEIEDSMINLPKKFDTVFLDNLISQFEKYGLEKNKREIELVQLKNVIKQNEERIKNVDKDIKNEKIKYINFLENNVSNLKNELKDAINDINTESISQRSSLDNKRNILKNELSNLKQDGVDEKQKITDYTNMLNGENQVCITCNQIIVNKDETHMNNLIVESKRKIEEITKNGKIKIEKLNECASKINEIESKTEKAITKVKLEFEGKINSIEHKINNFDVALIQDRISEIIHHKEYAEKENVEYTSKIEERENFLDKLDIEIKKLNMKISALKIDKALYDKYVDLSHKKDLLVSENKDLQIEYLDNNRIFESYIKNENLIKENERTNIFLNLIKDNIETLNYKRGELLNDKLAYLKEITLTKKVIDDLKSKLERYIEQEKLEELHNSYLKLMHRTGLPTYLLTKNVDILNMELDSLLNNTDFTLFFDDELNLKLSHNGLDDIINAIETSGMERTFTAIVLKMVLRIINFKSKPNFMFMDEVIDRLANKSVDRFMDLLETLRNKIDKIIIIDHNNTIASDMIINAVKDKNGVSKFEIL
jgi:DNA repair exonuclease SbcCD ATPase subunit/DNA repair exonuclease SbcCD nuclease subunit